MVQHHYAEVVESVDTRDLKSLAFGRAGSIPALGTNKDMNNIHVFCISNLQKIVVDI